MKKFNLVKKEIEEIIPNSPVNFDPEHSKRTLKWLLKLKPDADEALKISALGHDIERAITGISEKDLKDFSKLDEFKKEHSIRSANFIADIMKKNKYDKKIIEKVKHLIEEHEFVGDDEESNILTDADSLAFFDYNTAFYLERNGKEKTKHKLLFMYKRMSEKAKKLVNQIKFKNKEIDELFKETTSKAR